MLRSSFVHWLNQLIELLLSIFPRLQFLLPNEAGIRVTLGSRVRSIGPGYWWYWPLVQQISYCVVAPQVVDLMPQALRTKDGKELTISLTMRYAISDARMALLNVHSYDQALQNLTRGIVAGYVNGRTFDECGDIADIAENTKAAVQKAARGWGVSIQALYVDEIASTLNVRLMLRGEYARNTVDEE
ncbi:MAG: hypothetical protein DRP65_09350 [Planctomycetota bacterium]|nr:MAG: hypothetical protein DRP65_09350 [Planctomycetota bacterium]